LCCGLKLSTQCVKSGTGTEGGGFKSTFVVAAVEVCGGCLFGPSCWLIGNQPVAEANRCACTCPYKGSVGTGEVGVSRAEAQCALKSK